LERGSILDFQNTNKGIVIPEKIVSITSETIYVFFPSTVLNVMVAAEMEL